MDASKFKKLFDRGTVKEYINNLQGNIGGEPATMYLTENFAYFKARSGGNFVRISAMLELKTGIFLSETKSVTTDNIFTLYRN